MIYVVGSNPSPKNWFKTIAFIGTRSFRILQGWLEEMGVDDAMMINVSNQVTEPGVVPKVTQEDHDRLRQELRKATRVIAVGKLAHKHLTLLGIDHFALPHPSGLNRRLNDPAFIREELKRCAEWLKTGQK